MILDDAQVNLSISGQGHQGFCLHLVFVPQNEFEFLLVHGCRGQQGGFQTVREPGGRDAIIFIELPGRFHRVLDALRHTIAKCYYAMDHFFFSKGICPGNLLVGKTDPAGIQAKGLGQQHDALSVIAYPFFRILLSGHYKIVLHTGEYAIIKHPGREGFRFIYDQLDMETGCGIAFLNLLTKQVEFTLFDRLSGIFPH